MRIDFIAFSLIIRQLLVYKEFDRFKINLIITKTFLKLFQNVLQLQSRPKNQRHLHLW